MLGLFSLHTTVGSMPRHLGRLGWLDNAKYLGLLLEALSMTQQLQRLEKALQSTTDLATSIELTARIAIVLARLGRFEEAKAMSNALRQQHGDWRSGRIHVWIMLSEAIIDWFASLNSQALDRVTRVQALSDAMRYFEMHAIASAWKAHIQFEISDFDGMLRSIELAFRSKTEVNHDANARVAIVISNAFALCGDWVSAQYWFTRGRSNSLADGDLAGIEALQYNRAVLSLTCLRADSCMGPIDPCRTRAVRFEIDSSRNLNILTKNSALANHLHLAEARLLILECEFERASLALASVRNETPFAAYHFSQFAIDLEISYCRFRCNLIEEALAIFEAIDFGSFADLDIDDQFVAAHICHEMAKVSGRFGDSNLLSERESELSVAYSKSRAELIAGLQRFTAEGLLA